MAMAERASPMTEERREMSVADILSALDSELAALADVGERLQSLMGAVLRHSEGGADPLLVQEAQGLDALVQKLNALTAFLQTVAEAAPRDCRIDVGPALAAISLSDLAKRFGRAADDSGVLTPAGDCEMF